MIYLWCVFACVLFVCDLFVCGVYVWCVCDMYVVCG